MPRARSRHGIAVRHSSSSARRTGPDECRLGLPATVCVGFEPNGAVGGEVGPARATQPVEHPADRGFRLCDEVLVAQHEVTLAGRNRRPRSAYQTVQTSALRQISSRSIVAPSSRSPVGLSRRQEYAPARGSLTTVSMVSFDVGEAAQETGVDRALRRVNDDVHAVEVGHRRVQAMDRRVVPVVGNHRPAQRRTDQAERNRMIRSRSSRPACDGLGIRCTLCAKARSTTSVHTGHLLNGSPHPHRWSWAKPRSQA